MTEASPRLQELHERYSEAEKRFGTVFLSLLLVSVLYWISFALFLQDPQRTLVPDARAFIQAIDQLEVDQGVLRTQYAAKVDQALRLAETFLQQLDNANANFAKFDMETQIRIDDRNLLGLINTTNSTDFPALLRSWLDELRSFRDNRIVHEPDVIALQRVYFVMNQAPGWARRAASAVALEASLVERIPEEINQPAWSDLSAARVGLLFRDYPSFESAMNDLQSFYQGPVTDRMQMKTLLNTGVWLRNLDSGRQIARSIANAEPTIRLPVVGENVTGRLAFLFAPLLYLVMVRYLLVISDEIRHLRRQIEAERSEESQTRARVTGSRGKGTKPHMMDLLSAWLERRAERAPFDLVVNRTIVVALLALPVTTIVPVIIVNLTVFEDWWMAAAVTLLAAYALPVLDTIRLARVYVLGR